MFDFFIYLCMACLIFPVGFFISTCLCCQSCPTILSDTFTRSDSTNIGSDWTEVSGDWSITSNKLRISATTNAVATAVASSAGAIHRVSCVITSSAVGDKIRVLFNYEDSSNYDFGELEIGATNSTLRLFTRRGGSNTQRGQDRTVSSFTAGSSGTMNVCVDKTTGNARIFAAQGFASIASHSENNGSMAGVGTGGTVTGNVDFDTFLFRQTNNVVAGSCATCTDATNNCLDAHYGTDYQVVITGMGTVHASNPCPGDCATMNGTYVLLAGSYSFSACAVAGGSVTGIIWAATNSLGGTLRVQMQTTGGTPPVIAFVASPTVPIDLDYGACFFNGRSISPYMSGTGCDMTGTTCTISVL